MITRLPDQFRPGRGDLGPATPTCCCCCCCCCCLATTITASAITPIHIELLSRRDRWVRKDALSKTTGKVLAALGPWLGIAAVFGAARLTENWKVALVAGIVTYILCTAAAYSSVGAEGWTVGAVAMFLFFFVLEIGGGAFLILATHGIAYLALVFVLPAVIITRRVAVLRANPQTPPWG